MPQRKATKRPISQIKASTKKKKKKSKKEAKKPARPPTRDPLADRPGLLEAARPVIAAPAPVPAPVARRGTRRNRPRPTPNAGRVRLPTTTEEIRQRGLRFILTLKAAGDPADLVTRFRQVADVEWLIEPLFEPSDGDAASGLDRFYVAVVPGLSHRDLEVHPFDLADRLVAAAPADVASAEPDLPEDVFEPSHDPANPLRLRGTTRSGNDRPATEPPDWHRLAVNAQQAWDTPPAAGGAARGAGILIGHLDTGYTRHAAFDAGAFETTVDYDLVDDDEDASDPLNYGANQGHGTKTGSVIAGRGLPGAGSPGLGLAPAAKLLPIRAIKSVVVIWKGDVARAIKYAADHGSHVISMSLGGLGTRALEAAVNDAVARNVLVLAAAGNQVSWVVAPANYERCIAVAACNISDQPWRGSAHGRAVAITAPGENVVVAAPAPPHQDQSRTNHGSGTSFAVATTAGIAALWLAHHGRDNLLQRYQGLATLQDVFKNVLRAAARPVNGWDREQYGPGIVDAKRVLDASLPAVTRGSTTRGPAGGARAAALPATRSPIDQLATLFPDSKPAEVERTLRSLVEAPATRARASAELDRHATEMLHLLGTDPSAHAAFREAMAGRPMRRTATRRGTRGAALPTETARAAEIITNGASNTLARALQR